MPHHVPARSRARHLLAPALVALVAAGTACAEVGTDPNEAVSIQFNRLPSPSILVGDTLRNLDGTLVDLRDSVRVFNQDNDVIPGYPLRFVATVDTARVKYDSTTGYLYSTGATGLRSVGIQAQAGGLFPPPVNLTIVPEAPTTIDTVNADTTTLLVGFGPGVTMSQSSKELTVRVRAGDSLVTGWPVQFRAVQLPASLDSVQFIAARGDTLRASRRSPYDTTQSGTASRYVLAWRHGGAAAGTDTLVVEALFRVRGAETGVVAWRVPVIVQTAASAR